MSTPKFHALYPARDCDDNHVIRKDDLSGQIVLTVTLSGHRNDEPSQAQWASHVSACVNGHAALVARVAELEGFARMVECLTARIPSKLSKKFNEQAAGVLAKGKGGAL